MSRFGAARWDRILIWTGAALAWGTAVVVGRLEPARVADTALEPASAQAADSSHESIMPSPAPLGLVILRFTPVDAPAAVVRTVRVERTPTRVVSQPAQSAPQPASSGS